MTSFYITNQASQLSQHHQMHLVERLFLYRDHLLLSHVQNLGLLGTHENFLLLYKKMIN